MKIKKFDRGEEFEKEAANLIAVVCTQKNGQVQIGLSGGNTPRPIYERLANNNEIDFAKVVFFVVDERYVPISHPDSNIGMIEKSLINLLSPKPCDFFGFDTSLSWEKAAAEYDILLHNKASNGLDLIILGMGNDGHTASLFPFSPLLAERNHWAAQSETENFAIKKRLTMTFPVILASKKILLLIRGSEKEASLRELINGEKMILEFPARALLAHPNLTILYCRH